MNTLAYGKLLSDIGKKICDMSNNSEKNIIQTLNNNINICKNTLQQLKNFEPPLIFSHESLFRKTCSFISKKHTIMRIH